MQTLPVSLRRSAWRGLVATGLAAWALLAPGWARADVPVTAPERWLAVEQASLPAAARLYQLARLALPLCAEQRRWGFGPQPLRLAAQPVAHPPTEALRQLAMAQWRAQAGEAVFATVVPGTPWARAGVQAGDRLLNPADFDPAPRSAAAASATYLQRLDAGSAAFEARPTRQARVLRQGTELALAVKAEPSCGWAFRGIDSRWPYTLTGPGVVQATLPLLATLDEAQLTAVLAHEVAHVLRATTDESRRAPVTAARLLVLGSLVDLGANAEMGLGRPDDKALLQADHLALWLLRAQGVALRPYLAALQALAQRPHGLGEPAYESTRPLSAAREAALQQAVTQFEAERKLPLPAGIDRAALAALLRDGPPRLLASAAPATMASRAPGALRAHAFALPPASGFAAITDVDQVPLRAEGRARYAHYLGLPAPKAFFIVGQGGWRFHADEPRAMALGFDYCASKGLACWLYAVDDRVVWQADPARRIAALPAD